MRIIKSQKTEEKVLYILRGPSGSGKSTLANSLNPEVVFSTDDYFMEDGIYNWSVDKLKQAHQWNQKRAEKAMQYGFSPIVIDNTFTRAYEAKFYVQKAKEHGYKVKIIEPNWSSELKDKEGKWNANFIEKLQNSPERIKQKKSLPRNVVDKMVNRYEYDITEKDILNSKAPWEN